MVKILLSLLLLLAPLKLIAVDTELDCLTRNVYYEARGESRKGKLAVALVTLNRTENPNYPNTICGVVYQKKQFSWTNTYKKSKINAKQWRASKEAALEAYLDRDVLGKFNATHFHAPSVSPKWKLKRIATIGGHIFYM